MSGSSMKAHDRVDDLAQVVRAGCWWPCPRRCPPAPLTSRFGKRAGQDRPAPARTRRSSGSKSTVSASMSRSSSIASGASRASVYRMAAGGSPSTDPKLPWRIDQRVAEREVLGHPDQGVVDGASPCGWYFFMTSPTAAARLAARAVGPQAALEHRPQDPAMDRLQAVADVGQGAADDDRHRVVEEGATGSPPR